MAQTAALMDISWEPSEQIDVGPLGQLTAQVMEQLAERYADADDATVRTAAVIVEIDSGDCSEILTVCTDQRPWAHLAFLNEGKVSVERLLEQMERDAEE